MAQNPRPGRPTPDGESAAPGDSEQAGQARRLLERTERDSHTVFGGALGGLFGARPAADGGASGDPVERWGKIVGRVLGYGLALFLLFNLLSGGWL